MKNQQASQEIQKFKLKLNEENSKMQNFFVD